MSGSSEHELKALIRSLHMSNIGFLGTFDCRFPGFLNRNQYQSAIVNTGSRESGGMHWIAFAWNPRNFKVFMFDPLGWSAHQLKQYYSYSYQALLKRSALNSNDRCVILERNHQAIQCTCAGSCGLFCVFFLYCFSISPNSPFSTRLMQSMHGTSPNITPVSPELLHINQMLLYSFLSKNSEYFRKNEDEIVENTKLDLIKTH